LDISPERWQKIEQLYHTALEREPGGRSAFLDQACQDDAELRREVEALLAQGDAAGDSTATILTPGAQLGPYQIEAPIGAGGMGSVYRALDTRLGRKVAIKICAQQFSGRFEREARAISSLNHPHICTLYDVGPNYLVMELVEGETLAARLQKGRLPMAAVLRYAAEIADALAAAHALGIIHRDLKPQNIMIPKSGVKVLDFGLAKSPTDETLTATRVVMGTPAYMAPEQREGKECDARTDIYSLGVVLREMTTGKRDGTMLGLPLPLAHVIELCLEPDLENRWQSASDVKRELEWAGKSQPASVAAPRTRPWTIATAVAGIIAAVVIWVAWRQPAVAVEERPVQFQINPPPGVTFRFGVAGGSAISPDGRMMAVAGASSQARRLWLRSLDAAGLRELPTTDGAQYPFWSPDSRSIGFFAEGKLKRVDLSSGQVIVIAEAPDGRGGTWNSEGTIVFAPTIAGHLLRVSAGGGTPVAVTEGFNHRWPEFLPDGRQFLFFSAEQPAGAYLSFLDRPREKATRLITTPTSVAYSPLPDQRTGYLFWIRGSTPVAQPLDLVRAQLTGDAVPVPGLEPVPPGTLYRSFSVARDGTILVERGELPYQLTWFDRQGRPQNTVGRIDRYADVHLAPDENGAAVSLVDSSGLRDIWVLEFARAAYTRVTSGGIGFVAVWSPDGKKVAYQVVGSSRLYTRSANGVGSEEKLLESRFGVYINDWSADGRYLVYTESAPETKYDLWLVPTFGDRKPVPFLKTPASEWQGQISPDGKWIAYTSDESGRPDVYVRSFPEGAAKWPVSNSGGSFPRWRRDGRELFYRASDGLIMAAIVRAAGQGLEFGSPAALFRVVEPLGAFSYPYDVSHDGTRILALNPGEGASNAAHLTVLMNWHAGLKK
jgi:Tol biopolymer transport system component